MIRMMIRLKHWVLFLILVGPPLLAQVVSPPNGISQLETSATVMTLILYFGWLWNINTYVSSGKDVLFRICLAVVLIYFIGFNLLLVFGQITEEVELGIFNLFVLSAMIFCLVVISKRLRSQELNRSAPLNEYLVDVVLLFMFPIGIWILQPRINRLSESVGIKRRRKHFE